ncbi:MAG: sulfurtransferase [Herminiimonas sp.]|nr:sulfurtransferase [Herminiimonas sp.]
MPELVATDYPIINIAAYRFVGFDADEAARARFLEVCNRLALKGTILLSPEGINLFLAGTREAIDGFLMWLRADVRFADIEVKESGSQTQPFKRMLVKCKPELITMKHPLIKPELGRAPAVAPATLKRWLDAGMDDAGRPVVMLDTRNGFEVDVGTFDGTVDYRIAKFSEFPAVVEAHRDDFTGKTVVTFCTGGIRCEKAAIHMHNVGFEHVYQLDGGILKYFEEVGGAHYTGDCFVFDHRTAVNPALVPMPDGICSSCGTTVSSRTSLALADTVCAQCAQQSIN